MHTFSTLCTSTIKIIKENNQQSENIKCSFSKDKITLFLKDLKPIDFEISIGDKIERLIQPNKIEKYRINDYHFTDEFFDIPSAYELIIKKEDIKEQSVQTINNIAVLNGNINISEVKSESK